MENTKDKIKELTQKLEQGIKDVFTSDRWKQYLSTAAKFHKYSYGNVVMISMQRPGATAVAGFNTWKNTFGRTVNKGEKGIAILAPVAYKYDAEREAVDGEGNKTKETATHTGLTFRPVYVFDVSQTSGKELPRLVDELQAGVTDYGSLLTTLKAVAHFPVEFKDIAGSANGYCSFAEEKIVVKRDMSQSQTVKTLLHEMAHAELHDRKTSHIPETNLNDHNTREVEAESIAYVVGSHFGVDSSEYTFGYIAAWSKGKDLPELRASLSTIQSQSHNMIEKIQREHEIAKNRLGEHTLPTEITSTPAAKETTQGETKQTSLSAEMTVGFSTKHNQVTPVERTYTIYQLAGSEANRPRKWASMAELEQQKEEPELKNYNAVYSGTIDATTTVEDIYLKFNLNRPTDFTGHSLSMSDVIVIESSHSKPTAHYINDIGFVSCPPFATSHERQKHRGADTTDALPPNKHTTRNAKQTIDR
ncbi:MAG: ImmA/IrrE family metallo-endopeptidase [Peptococcaceae bacterium]|nr:ImmA/IrrE family metallo-endopeptidase [Peptococcaceae bacterium]